MNRNSLRKLILKEFKMMGMADMGTGGLGVMGLGKGGHHGYDAMSHSHGYDAMSHSHGCDACGHSPCQCDEFNEYGEEDFMEPVDMNQHLTHGSVSREDCCAAVMCLIECCSCPETKARLKQCCEDLLGKY